MTCIRRKCKLDPDVFCYMWQLCCIKTADYYNLFRKYIMLIFGIKLGDQYKPWAPHSVCRSCVENLRQWTKGKKELRFGMPTVWREQRKSL